MPTVMIQRNWSDSEPSPEYQPLRFIEPDLARLKALRAEYARSRDELLGFQKQARDRETARFFKEEANWNLKLFRAADAWVKWIGGESGYRPPSDWPPDLGVYFDRVQAMGAEAQPS